MESRRGPERRTYDRDFHHPAKRPRYDDSHQSSRPSQFHSNQSLPHQSSRPPQNHSNHVSRYAKIAVKLPQPLPDLPPISEEYAKPTFTHSSRAPGEYGPGKPLMSYERLEFLGDAYIEIIASRLIWSHYKNLQPSRMSSIREMLVKNETLSEYSIAYGFDKKIDITPASYPTQRPAVIKLHGDVFEAYIAAIVVSDPVNGFETAESWLTKLWEPLLTDVQTEPANMKIKDELMAKIGGKGIKLDYVEEKPMVRGKGIETYFMGVYLTGYGYDNQHLGSGHGLTKRAAGMEAARKALNNHPLIDDLIAKKKAQLEVQAAEKAKELGEVKAVD